MHMRVSKVRIVLFLIEILIIIKVLSAFTHPRIEYIFETKDMQNKGAIEVEINGKGWYIDNSIELENQLFLHTAPVDLPKGSYKIKIYHQTDGDGTSVNLSSENVTYRLIAGRENLKLNRGYEYTEYEINLSELQKDFQLDFLFTGNGYAWIWKVEVMQNWNMECIQTLYAILIIGVIELLWMGIGKKKFYYLIKKECFYKSFVSILLLTIPVIISTLPCFSYYVIDGFDLNFHLMRIEGIANAIKGGCFPVRIQTNWLKGYGYPVSVFYGDGLLYIPAVLRMIGMPLQNAYKCFIFLINVLTAMIMYFAAKDMTKSRKMGILASYLYLLIPYRLSCIYTRAGVGEYTAMAFFPMIVWGLYRIYTMDTKSKEWKYMWVIPVIGFTGVIESHLLSTILVGTFTVVCCLLLFKKTFEKVRFIELLKVVLITISANVIYLVPILDYMQKEYRVLENAKHALLQTQGAFVSQIFSLIPTGQGISLSIVENLMLTNEMVFSLGVVAWCSLLLLIFYLGIDARRYLLSCEKISKVKNIYLFLGIGVIAIWMSSTVFPWDTIVYKVGVLKVIITSLQFPWRCLSIASVFLVLGSVIALDNDFLKKELEDRWKIGTVYYDVLYLVIGILVVISAGHFTSNLVSEGKYKYIIAECDLDDTDIMGAEYIPVGVNESSLIKLQKPEGICVSLGDCYAQQNRYVVQIRESQANGKISVPRMYYDGYSVKFENIKGWRECFNDEIGRVCFDVPAGYSGQAVICFREPWYWRIAEVISFVTIIIIGYVIIKESKSKASSLNGTS